MAILGFLIIILNQVVFLIGQSKTSAGHSSLMFATIPIFIYIMAIIFLGEKHSWRRTLGILIGGAGVYLILSGGKIQFGTEYVIGDLLVLLAAASWAIATIVMKPLAIEYGAFRVTGGALLYGTLFYLPFGIFILPGADYTKITWVGCFSVFYLAVIVSIVVYGLWYWTLKYMEASRLAITHNIQPIIAAASAALFLGETIGLNFIIGGAIILAGVILIEIK
jgi:drug/metabolite transporter (DMT)-like permease